jgi:uncharacterized membrane protein HdeD (DUF308 family)
LGLSKADGCDWRDYGPGDVGCIEMGSSLLSPNGAGLKAFTLFEGVLMLVLGVLALIFPVVASAWITVIVAVSFLVGGIVGWVSNLARSRQLGRWYCFSRLVISTLFIVVGAWMIQQFRGGPLDGGIVVASLAFAIGLVFILEGVVSILTSLGHTQMRGWGWGLLNGIVTLILGVLIVTMQGWGLLWVIGVLVGISFLFSGIDLLAFSARFHGDD